MSYNGKIYRKVDVIAKKYMKWWFWWDLLALIPMRAFGYEMIGYYFRMSRLFKLSRILNFFDDSGIGVFINIICNTRNMNIPQKQKFDNFGKFVEILLLLCFSSYFLACFWFWYSNLVADDWPTAENFDDYFEKIDRDPNSSKMLVTWYFMITTLTTVGYGDLFPVSTAEYAFVIFIMLIGIAFFAYVIGVINDLVIRATTNEEEEKRMVELVHWLDVLEDQH